MPTLEALSNSLALTPSPALAVDRSGTIRFANRRVEELMGYPAGALVGQPIEVLVPAAVRPHHPELRQAFFSVPHERAMGTGRDLFAERSPAVVVSLCEHRPTLTRGVVTLRDAHRAEEQHRAPSKVFR